jgi:hypothetical protein
MSPKEKERIVHRIPNDFSLLTGGNRVEPVPPVLKVSYRSSSRVTLSQSAAFVSGDELQLVIIPFVTVNAVATETGLRRFTQLSTFFYVLDTSSNGTTIMSPKGTDDSDYCASSEHNSRLRQD